MASGKQVQARRISNPRGPPGASARGGLLPRPRIPSRPEARGGPGDVNPGDALATGEMLEFLGESLRRRMTSERVTVYFGAAPSAGFALGSPSATLVPAPSDVEVVLIVPETCSASSGTWAGSPPPIRGASGSICPRSGGSVPGPGAGPLRRQRDGRRSACTDHGRRGRGRALRHAPVLSVRRRLCIIDLPLRLCKDIDAPVNSIAAKLSSFILGLGQQYRRVHIVTHSRARCSPAGRCNSSPPRSVRPRRRPSSAT